MRRPGNWAIQAKVKDKKKAEGLMPSAGNLTHVGEPPNPHESVSKKTKGENETLGSQNPIKF